MQAGTPTDAAERDLTDAKAVLSGAARLRKSQNDMVSLAARRVEAIMRELLIEIDPREFLGPWDTENGASDRVDLARRHTDRPTS